jgi:hypothetical protein
MLMVSKKMLATSLTLVALVGASYYYLKVYKRKKNNEDDN